jgi:hypothetical protein
VQDSNAERMLATIAGNTGTLHRDLQQLTAFSQYPGGPRIVPYAEVLSKLETMLFDICLNTQGGNATVTCSTPNLPGG